MASSSSSAKRTGGNDTSEYKIVRGHLGPLVKLCQHVLANFANELFSKELISKLEHSNAIDKSQPMYDRTTNMMDSVLTKIETNSACFDKLLLCLRESEQNSIADDLETALREDRGRCPSVSMSGSSLLPQNVVSSSSTRAADIQSSTSANNSIATSDELVDDSSKPDPGDKFVRPVTDSGAKLLARGSVLIPSRDEGFDSLEDDPVAVSFKVEPQGDQSVLQPILEEGSPEQNPPPRPSPSTGSGASLDFKQKFPSRTLPHCMSVDRQLAHRSLRQLTHGWSSSKTYRSSPVVGDPMDLCVKPMLPLQSNPLVDALNTPILSPLKLVKMHKVQDGFSRCDPFPSPYSGDIEKSTAEQDEPSSLPSAQIAQEDEPPTVSKTRIAQEEDPSSLPQNPIAQEEEASSIPEAPMVQRETSVNREKHPMVKRNSFQSVCICHVKIEFLQTKLSNRMKEIDILKSQVDQLVVHFEEERERKTEAIKTQAQLKAQRDKQVNSLEEEIAFKNKLMQQLERQKKDYMHVIQKLTAECENKEKQKHIAESFATKMVSRSAELHERLIESEATAEHFRCSYEGKCKTCEGLRQKIYTLEKEHESEIARLESQLTEAKQRELELRQQMVRTGYETVKSEMVAEIEECIYETNTTTWSTLAPILQRRVEREMRKATRNLDTPSLKIAEELIRKTSSMILAMSKAPPLRSRSMSNGEREALRALDLVTPDKDIEFTW